MFLEHRFSQFKNFFTKSVFGELHFRQISLNFETSFSNLNIKGLQGLGAKLCVAFLLFLF